MCLGSSILVLVFPGFKWAEQIYRGRFADLLLHVEAGVPTVILS